MSDKLSYTQILKSSSIMGGSAGINMLLGMVRTKFAAVLIGTTGIGLLTSLTAIQGLIGIIAGLGIKSSAVREVAVAIGKNDEEAIGRAILTLRRISWLTGLVGMMVMIALSPFLSQLTFDSSEYTVDIAALGVIILLANISGGQMALIQGMRRIGDMAKANIIGAVLATVSAIAFYTWLGLRGIVPSLVVMSVMQLIISWYFAKRVPVPTVELSWRETFTEASSMVRLGLIFMLSGLMGSAVSYITITLITHQVSLQAVGIYSAAFALSGMFVNFVLEAMNADYYPRLTGLGHNKTAMNRLVNEQTEIGLLLAMPGLLATMVLAPWIVQIFYTSEFFPAVELIQWFLLGALGRVISWPLGFIMIAMKKNTWFVVSETLMHLIHIIFILIGLKLFGLEGVAIAFFSLYTIYIFVVYSIAKYLISFSWTNSVQRELVMTFIVFTLMMVLVQYFSFYLVFILGIIMTLVMSVYCLRGLIIRIGDEHRIARFMFKIPGMRMICKYRFGHSRNKNTY